MRHGLTWGELLLTVLIIFLIVGVGFIPLAENSAFFNRFSFMWLCFAAFVGMTPVLALRIRCLRVLWHIGTAMYILLCIGLCLHDQNFFASGGIRNLLWSAPAVIGLFLAETENKRFPTCVRIFAIPITLAVLTVSVISTLDSPTQFFFPLLFMPKENLESAHRLFFVVFMSTALLSFGGCFIASSNARRTQAELDGTETAGPERPQLWRFCEATIALRTKIWMAAGLIGFLLLLFTVVFFIPGTCSGSGEFRLPDFRDSGHSDQERSVSADDVVAYLISAGCVQNEEGFPKSQANHPGREPIASLSYPLPQGQSLQLVVCIVTEGRGGISIRYKYGKISGYGAWYARGKIQKIRGDLHKRALTETQNGDRP